MENLFSVFLFVLKIESGLNLDNLRKNSHKINYPQWVATIGSHGWSNSITMGSIDKAALFPLNLTPSRLHGDISLRRKYFKKYREEALKLIAEKDLPTNLELQLISLATSQIQVGWNLLNDKEKKTRYKKLWVGFSGSLWLKLKNKRESLD